MLTGETEHGRYPRIPFHLPSIGEEEIAEVVEVLRSGWLTTGQKVRRFEEALPPTWIRK